MRIEVHDRELWLERLKRAEMPYHVKWDELTKEIESLSYEAWKEGKSKWEIWWGEPTHLRWGRQINRSSRIQAQERVERKIDHLRALHQMITNCPPQDTPYLEQYDLSLMGDYAHWQPTQEDECTL